MPSLVPAVLRRLIDALADPTVDAAVLEAGGRHRPLPMALRRGPAAAMTATLLESGERRLRAAGMIALAVLCPVLLWCAAYGITPLVRGGYALMAAGTAILVYAEWAYLEWCRQARPGSPCWCPSSWSS